MGVHISGVASWLLKKTSDVLNPEISFCEFLVTLEANKGLYFKGQLGVPLTVYPWYLLCSLGILGNNLPINTHYIGLI